MLFLYNIFIYIIYFILHIVALFNKKLSLFVKGRHKSFAIIKEKIQPDDLVFWIHVASLGEYEQGLPLMEELKKDFPNHKILLTFFSPSGYQVKKDNTIAHCTIYLPMDTKTNAKKLLDSVNIQKAFFIKYEFWPNYLNALRKKEIPTYLISGIFRKDQVFFKWYAGFYREALKAFTYFFVQNKTSLELLKQLHYSNALVVGDTRFDRVSQILKRDNSLDFLDTFTKNKTSKTIVIGSSWPQDEALLINYINQNQDKTIKYIFAPHNIKSHQIEQLKDSINKKVVLHSESTHKDLAQSQVYIIDAYSLLTKAYSYATIAYIGGGFTHGIHNILEAATFGVPIIIGPKYSKFQEAKDLIALQGVEVVSGQKQLDKTLDTLLYQDSVAKQTGQICYKYIAVNQDATRKIMDFIFPK